MSFAIYLAVVSNDRQLDGKEINNTGSLLIRSMVLAGLAMGPSSGRLKLLLWQPFFTFNTTTIRYLDRDR